MVCGGCPSLHRDSCSGLNWSSLSIHYILVYIYVWSQIAVCDCGIKGRKFIAAWCSWFTGFMLAVFEVLDESCSFRNAHYFIQSLALEFESTLLFCLINIHNYSQVYIYDVFMLNVHSIYIWPKLHLYFGHAWLIFLILLIIVLDLNYTLSMSPLSTNTIYLSFIKTRKKEKGAYILVRRRVY